MLSDAERELILACAHKYGVTELYLFGSTLESEQYRDIDLGVKGVPRLYPRNWMPIAASVTFSNMGMALCWTKRN